MIAFRFPYILLFFLAFLLFFIMWVKVEKHYKKKNLENDGSRAEG